MGKQLEQKQLDEDFEEAFSENYWDLFEDDSEKDKKENE